MVGTIKVCIHQRIDNAFLLLPDSEMRNLGLYMRRAVGWDSLLARVLHIDLLPPVPLLLFWTTGVSQFYWSTSMGRKELTEIKNVIFKTLGKFINLWAIRFTLLPFIWHWAKAFDAQLLSKFKKRTFWAIFNHFGPVEGIKDTYFKSGIVSF